MRERTKKAFDFAAESTKLLITLSTGIIALTITFSKEFVPDLSGAPLWPMAMAWSCFLLSILFGVATMLSLTGLLSGDPAVAQDDEPPIEPSVYAPTVTRWSLIQIVFFLLALSFTCVHGCASLSSAPSERSGTSQRDGLPAAHTAAMASAQPQKQITGAGPQVPPPSE